MAPRSLKYATISAFITSGVFALLFQLSKIRAIQNAAPFADDPFDAVASFAFQIALAVGLLSLARLVSIKNEKGLRQRLPFILHGIWMVVLCVAITLLVDFASVARAWPLPASAPSALLLAGLALLTLLAANTGGLLARAQREAGRLPAEPVPGALGGALEDCWRLVGLIPTWLIARLPRLKPGWEWVDSLARRIARAWSRRLPFADPYRHPWNFALLFAILLGLAIMGAILVSEAIVEGGPRNLSIGLLLAGIFFGGEMLAILLCFLFFGSYLGLRPRIHLVRTAG